MRNLVQVVLAVLATIVVSYCKPEPLPLVKPSVTIQPATNVTITSATLVASVVPNENGAIVSFEYKITAVATDWQIVTLPTAYSGKTSVNVMLDISNLSSQTEYSYRVKATSAAGQSISAINTFTTLAAPVKPGVAIKPAINVEITKATLVAEVVPNENGTTVSFEYKTLAASTWTTVPVSGTFSGKDSVEVSVALTTLVANTEYSYRVKATNVAGETISSESKFQVYGFCDYDNNLYRYITVIANGKTYDIMTSNFRGKHFKDGSAIIIKTQDSDWVNTSVSVVPAMCFYNNSEDNAGVYGGLYNFYVVADPRGIAPTGWYVPTVETYIDFINLWGGREIAGGNMKVTGTSLWVAPNSGATNSSGFSAVPSAGRGGEQGICEYLGFEAGFWTSSQAGPGALIINVCYNSSGVMYNMSAYKTSAFSIRFIRQR